MQTMEGKLTFLMEGNRHRTYFAVVLLAYFLLCVVVNPFVQVLLYFNAITSLNESS